MFQGMLFRASAYVADVFARLRNERGQGLMEYAILLGAIAITAGVALYVTNAFSFVDFADTIQSCLDFEEAGCDFG
jgi:hypothetical protein